MKPAIYYWWFAAFFCAVALAEASLPQATVTKAAGKVQVFPDEKAQPHPAKVREVIKDENILQTGARSRAELEFQNTTITRLGSHTVFTFNRASRTLNLKEGTVLVQVFNKEGHCKVVTPAITAAIEGTTALVSAQKGGDSDVYLFESSKPEGIKVTAHATGETVRLKPGNFIRAQKRLARRLKIQSFNTRRVWKQRDVCAGMGSLKKNVDKRFGDEGKKEKKSSTNKKEEKKIKKVKNITRQATKSAVRKISKPPAHRPRPHRPGSCGRPCP